MRLPSCPAGSFRLLAPGTPRHFSTTIRRFSSKSDDAITTLSSQPQHHLSLGDLLRPGRPPLSESALLASANFTRSLLPIRLAHRIQAIRSLPFIVVSNPHIHKIYETYTSSFEHLYNSLPSVIDTIEKEEAFTERLADLVEAHTDTIPTLARGFLECQRYLPPAEITRFIDTHLRARIGTRLIAEQHLALHHSTKEINAGQPANQFIGTINPDLRPADVIKNCAEFVSEICVLQYGVAPALEMEGDLDTPFAYIPAHLEYIMTELLKNAFRATLDVNPDQDVLVTIIAEHPGPVPSIATDTATSVATTPGVTPPTTIKRSPKSQAPALTIRIRDQAKGIPPAILPNIWSYAFTTVGDEPSVDDQNSFMYTAGGVGGGGLGVLGDPGVTGGSSLAGLGYGLPLSRAYAEFFGGGIKVESLFGWGTDVYLRLEGVGDLNSVE